MTCSHCGSTAVGPNGYCTNCGQPASPSPSAWPAPGASAGQDHKRPPVGAGYSYGPPPADSYPPPYGIPTQATGPGTQPYVNAAVPPYGAPQGLPYAVPPQPYNPYPVAGRPVGNNFSIAAFVLAGVAFLLFPILGILGVIFGSVALRRGERWGKLGLILAIAGTVLGFVVSTVVSRL
jgi:hypothetical protein